jgi:hypothetical protein
MAPPGKRNANQFDAGAKYHVAADVGYVRQGACQSADKLPTEKLQSGTTFQKDAVPRNQ